MLPDSSVNFVPGGSDSGNDSGNNSDTGSNAGIVTTVPTGRLQVSGTKLTDESAIFSPALYACPSLARTISLPVSNMK